MAFDFLGTFTTDEFDSLVKFVERRADSDLKRRIAHLRIRIQRLGWIYRSGSSHTIDPEDSLLAKRIQTYRFLGGDLEDLEVLSRGEWIHLVEGDPQTSGDFKGGRPSDDGYLGQTPYNDRDPAVHVDRMKRPFESTFKRLENAAYRVRRVIDLADQYVEESVLIAKRLSGAETFEDLRERVEFMINSDDFASAGREG